MKKITTLLTCLIMLAITSSASAAIKIAEISRDQNQSNGADYTGVIKAAVYRNKDIYDSDTGVPSLYISTAGDKTNKSNFFQLGFIIDGNDLAFGQTLANSIGKKITIPAGQFNNLSDTVSMITLSADDYRLSANDLTPQK